MEYNFLTAYEFDYGCQELAKGSRGKIIPEMELRTNTAYPVCWPGLYKPELLEICRHHSLDFYNLDTGYFGNRKRKVYFRLTKNNFANIEQIKQRSDDRWTKLQWTINNFQRGRFIVIVPPDRKICRTLNLGTEDEWIADITKTIANYTDRPVKIRKRPEPRADRIIHDTFLEFIKKDTWCVVGYSSNALVEAALSDIPTVALGHSATKSLYNTGLDKIEQLTSADSDHKQAWINHLSYSQFTREELASGFAWDIIHS